MVRSTVQRPVPVPTPTTQSYWDGTKRSELWIQQCITTGKYFTYPRILSPYVVGGEVRWVKASGRGKLHSYVISHIPGPGYEGEVPYIIAIVELEEGPRVTGNVVGVEPVAENLHLDMPLVVDFEARGAVNVPHFRPQEKA